MTAYQLKPWTQVVTPHADITSGNIDNAIFAASLSQVVRKDPNCPEVYRDARKFFEATYLTKELRNLLNDVLKGLNGQPTDKVIQLRTPFGGGKTHSLVSLYHLTQNRPDLSDLPEINKLPNPSSVKVAAFIGLDMGAQSGIELENGQKILTPWGYLAWQIGGAIAFNLIAEEDSKRIAPGNDTLRKIIGDEPTLILLDEFLVYVENAMGVTVGDSTFGRQVLTFIQRLTEVVRELPKTVMVYSLQASVQEALGDEGLLNVLDKLVSRIDAKKEPVSGDEVMKVVQRRLFADIGDPEVIKEVARQQADLYRKFYNTYADGDRAQQEIEQQAQILAERIESSYPFHPDLLDLMYLRWGSLPSYQRTRGALQFLARTVSHLWQQHDPLWLIHPGSIPLEDINTKQAFFSQVGQRDAYDSVISADITGRKAKVNIINNRLANDVPAIANLKIGTRLASAILLYSFGAKSGEDRGVMEQEIVASCLTGNLDRTILTAALSDLRDELLYLHYIGKRYRFETKPNLNKLIADEESKISTDEGLLQIRQQLEANLKGGRGEIVLWAKDSSSIPDNLNKFIAIYLDAHWSEKSTETLHEDVMHWLEYRGNSKRTHKNCLAFVVPNRQQMDKARSNARTYAAIISLLEQKNKYKFSAEDISELKEKGNNSKQGLKGSVDKLYEKILLPIPDRESDNPTTLKNIDLLSQVNTSSNLQERVLDALRNDVFENLTVNKLVRLSGISPERPYIQVSALIQAFFQYPDYPKLLDQHPVKRAIQVAIARGDFGYVPNLTITDNSQPIIENPQSISINIEIPNDEFDTQGYLLEKDLVTETLAQYQAKQNQTIDTSPEEEEKPVQVTITYPDSTKKTDSMSSTKGNYDTEKPSGSSIERNILVDIKEGKQPAKHYRLNAKLDAAQLFQLVTILQNLSDQSSQVSVNLTVDAHAKDAFDLQWLRNAIEEPIDEADIQATTSID
ncbi:ATP-binding protein [[Limnothrix rosea] IAM M-220]|uniref:ATP-binding protein n=1 Tax=[Limnothrix rosea] IAM M-220 TaxID=454133 RepID=UPI0009590169|nr:DUF499 domain-containing protein [[Limnothrix rosea] IAM M-220]OKH17690.1 hypothetical protein NIES208_08535 [[Limnothrix rosea] IAM M-220]